MSHKPAHTIGPDTVEALQIRKTGTLRETAKTLGFGPSYAAMLSDVLAMKPDKVSTERENELRKALGLPPVRTLTGTPRTRQHYYRPCLSRDPDTRRQQLQTLLEHCKA